MRHWTVAGFFLAFVLMAAAPAEANGAIRLYQINRCGTSAAQPICRRASFLAAYNAAVAQARITRLIATRFLQGQCARVVSPSTPC